MSPLDPAHVVTPGGNRYHKVSWIGPLNNEGVRMMTTVCGYRTEEHELIPATQEDLSTLPPCKRCFGMEATLPLGG